MVRAILDGTKTQTRRVVKPTMTAPRVAPLHMEPWIIDGEQEVDDHGYPCWAGSHPDYPTGDKWFTCPYGQPGERLWVRETWFKYESGDVIYRADYDPDKSYEGGAKGWRPSIFMPRAASRITLEIAAVRVERVRDISGYDALKEGVTLPEMANGPADPTVEFMDLWDSINEKRGYGWAVNPWVWVVEFKKV